MSEVEEKTSSIRLKPTADLGKRVEILSLLFEKAESKVTHADTFRQRNMNYSLVIFAGLIALGMKLTQFAAQAILSATLLILMIIFCVWDRRWHRIKHGWQSTANEAYRRLSDLINDPEKEIVIPLYKISGERKAEYFSLQPIVFYFLVVGAASSFLLFNLVSG